jgi:zinc/manganese transport system permease protein
MGTGSLILIMLPAFCECLVLVGIHSYLGIHVIKRKVIFVDLAFAQIAALGTLIAFLFGIPPHTPSAFVFAVFLTAIGAAIFSLCRFRRGRIPQEAVIGLVYAIAAAAAILLIDKAPHGAEHLKEILTGSILWVKWESVIIAALVYSAVGAFHYVFRKRFLAISDDADAAWKAGVNVRLWDFLFYLSFGLVITVSVDVAGVLIVFVFLVAPAILALLISTRLTVQLLTGWGLGVLVTTVGLILAYVLDLSTGPAVIATYGVTMVLAAAVIHVVRAPRRGRALRNALLVAAGFAVAGALLAFAGSWLGRSYREQALTNHRGGPGVTDPEEVGSEPDDPEEQADAVVAMLTSDPPRGAAMALRFLARAPPPFFGECVVSRLRQSMGTHPGFVIDEEPDSEANQRAVARVRTHFGLD